LKHSGNFNFFLLF